MIINTQPNKSPTIGELIKSVREWLGVDGIAFFRETKQKHGRIDAVYMEGNLPHPVHFREGMWVRNFLRKATNNAWTSIEYDENWVEIVEKAIQPEREHEANCPALQAWDIPESCDCGRGIED